MARHSAPAPAFRTVWEENDSRLMRGLHTDTRGHGKHAYGPAPRPAYVTRERYDWHDMTPAGMAL